MASVSGVTSSNSSSIYGNRTVLSGLATGMDTETMIENAVSGYKLKISSLQQKQTKLTWQQEAMREISSPMIKFAQKYTSYSSSTNLLSASFFNKAVLTTAQGTNASKVSATGKTNSSVEILGVQRLATKASYSVSASELFGDLVTTGTNGEAMVTAVDSMNPSDKLAMSKVSGSLTLNYGGSRSIDLNFGDLDTYSSAKDFVAAINSKLANTSVTNSSGEKVSAADMVEAKIDEASGTVTFVDAQNAGNGITITAASGELKSTLGIDASQKPTSFTVPTEEGALVNKDGTKAQYLSGKTFSMTVDGKTKTITLPQYDQTASDQNAAFEAGLQKAVKDAFGSSVSVKLNADSKLEITGQKGSTISISAASDVGRVLGLRSGFAASYLDTGKTLGDLLGKGETADGIETLGGIEGTAMKSDGTITKQKDGSYLDSSGNLTDSVGNRLGTDGKQLYSYDFEINGKKMTFTRDSSLDSVLTAVNSDATGLNATFSKTTNKLQLSSRETGAGNQVTISATVTDKDGNQKTNLAAKLFGVVDSSKTEQELADLADSGFVTSGKYIEGQDAVLSMKVNGEVLTDITRSDNNFDVDGLSITLKGAFGYVDGTDADGNAVSKLQENPDAVTFTTTADSDKLVETITGMIADLNEILKSVHDGYATLPNYKSDKSRYEPLTDDDRSSMSDSAIEKYEEKAKQGLLFGDSDLSSLYSKLISAISPGGAASGALSKIGITTSYSDGVTSLTVDEDTLRSALENDPESVRDAFTSTSGTGGLMVNVSKVFTNYVSTSGSTKGVLVQKAGSVYSPLSLLSNDIQDQVDDYDDQITRWQSKLSDKVDYYTQMFTRLEQLTSTMNSQSSMITSMLGG